MKSPDNELQMGSELAAYARQFYSNGWMWGTGGNLSVRLSNAPFEFLVTPSGVAKGEIEPHQFVVVGGKNIRLAGTTAAHGGAIPLPSAETEVHRMLYEMHRECNAVFHVHPASAAYISGVYGHASEVRELDLPWIEMMKVVGMKEGEIGRLPIFPNDQTIPRFAQGVKDYLQRTAGKKIPGILIYNHGLTVWGRTMDEARNYSETIEYVCEQRYRALCAGNDPTL